MPEFKDFVPVVIITLVAAVAALGFMLIYQNKPVAPEAHQVPVTPPVTTSTPIVMKTPEALTVCQLPGGKYSRGERFQNLLCDEYKVAIARAVSASPNGAPLWICWIMDPCFFHEYREQIEQSKPQP